MILNNCQYLGLYLVLKTFIGLLNVYKLLQCLLGCRYCFVGIVFTLGIQLCVGGGGGGWGVERWSAGNILFRLYLRL